MWPIFALTSAFRPFSRKNLQIEVPMATGSSVWQPGANNLGNLFGMDDGLGVLLISFFVHFLFVYDFF